MRNAPVMSAADIRWFEVDPCYVFHPLNAYDAADGTVVETMDSIAARAEAEAVALAEAELARLAAEPAPEPEPVAPAPKERVSSFQRLMNAVNGL